MMSSSISEELTIAGPCCFDGGSAMCIADGGAKLSGEYEKLGGSKPRAGWGLVGLGGVELDSWYDIWSSISIDIDSGFLKNCCDPCRLIVCICFSRSTVFRGVSGSWSNVNHGDECSILLII